MKIWTRPSPGRLALVFVAVVFAWPLMAEERHALLIGCTVYPNFASDLHLVGPANDVLLAKKLLVERFQFPEKNVTILADNQGNPNSLPTRANIEREWRRLADVANQGDQLVVLMAGHGTQSPQREWDDDNPENDGLDEVFLPRDVGSWNAKIGELENSIRDDDIRDWINAISESGASLWVIIDACNSGTMTRNASDEVKRELRPDVLGIPEAAIQQAHALAASRGSVTTENEVQLLESGERTRGTTGATLATPNAPVVVALYAAQSFEGTVEKLLPIDGAEKKYYGLLTYTLSEILTQAQSPMTYRELVGQIHRRYVGMNRTSPTPVLEGTTIDREVLGLKTFPERSRIVLEQDQTSGGWKINSGALSGTTKHSVMALYPPAGEANADQVMGHVKVLDGGLQALEARPPIPKNHGNLRESVGWWPAST
ncbi:MAG: caspase family protein [Planctomycetales bacterium]|nr:caspase family protein [Planctomycetales bacterium]